MEAMSCAERERAYVEQMVEVRQRLRTAAAKQQHPQHREGFADGGTALECVAAFLTGEDVARCAATSWAWAETLSMSSMSSHSVWADQCDRFWATQLFVPSHFWDRSAMSPAEAYWRSRADCERTEITTTELCCSSGTLG